MRKAADSTARKRGKKKADSPKRRLILDAALHLFSEKGYDITSTDEIAGLAGVSKATVYSHFKSKEALLAAVVKDKTDGFPVTLLPEPAGKPLRLRDALRRIGEMQVSMFITRCDFTLTHLVAMQASRFPEIGRIFWEAGAAKVLAELTRLFREADAGGELDVPDPELAAVQFISLVRGDAPFMRLLLPDAPIEDKLRKQLDGAVHMIFTAYKGGRKKTRAKTGAGAAY